MQINVNDFLKKNRYNTLNLIDVRNQSLYQKGHIVNAKNIEASELIYAPEHYLKQNETYYIYCQTGSTSNKIVHILNSRGYHTYNIVGGYNNYLLWK